MKTEQFLTLLSEYKDKSLLFEYAPNQFIGANYHITEVKHLTIDSVDCGARTDAWKETIIQLWESPLESFKKDCMTAKKALGILNKVGQMKPYSLDSEVKIEYSNTSFHTAQLFIDDFDIHEHKLIIRLAVKKTDCKAKKLCAVVDTLKALVKREETCCSTDGNCC